VVLNANSALPEAAVPMQAAGGSLIVFEGDPAEATAGATERVDLGENLVARVRVAEPIFADGTSAELQPDLVVRDAAEEAAVKLAREFHPSTVARPRLPASADARGERSYAAMEYPAPEYRLLALFRFWSAIEYFYPYKRLLREPWDSVLPEFVPKFERAGDAVEYSRAVAELATRLHDGHAYVAGSVFNKKVIGDGYPPVRVRVVEGLPVVTSLADPEAGAAGVEIGDVVVSVDGEDARARLARYAELISASTPQGLADKAAISFMNGAVGSPVRLRLRGAAGVEREVTLSRKAEDYTTLYHRERTGDVVKLLAGNIGYVDLDRLTIPMVDDMFEKLKNTRAIVFDMRGYPNGAVWAIAPRLSSAEQRVALLETPMVGHDAPGEAVEAFYQTIGPTPPGAWLYTGKTVMLVDERTVSQAEHTGLFLLAANGTKFVGSPSAGTDGEITTIVLPGGITVGFTGQSVRYPDGRELQGRGLVPDVLAAPTIAGVREGRDEVLEAAVAYLDKD
jgi:C-terminal processing protease CtpA/Prc